MVKNMKYYIEFRDCKNSKENLNIIWLDGNGYVENEELEEK